MNPFTKQQIYLLKNNNYPPIKLKNVTIANDYITIQFFVEEEYGGEKKIFKNPNKQNLKIKVFTVKNNSSLVIDSSNITKINELIKKNNLDNKEIFAYSDYKGSPLASEDELREDDNVILQYEVTFKAQNVEDIRDLTANFIMYEDLEAYSRETNSTISEDMVEILTGNLNSYVVKQNNENLIEEKLQDFQTAKAYISSFRKAKDFFETLKDMEVSNSRTYYLKNKSYFTPAFFSMSEKQKLNFIFGFDIKRLLEDNKYWSEFDIDLVLAKYGEELFNIASLKIFKREYEGKTKKLKKQSQKALISSSDETNSLITAEDDVVDGIQYQQPVSRIREISLFKKLRTFEVMDSLAYLSENSTIQYGVQIILSDKKYSVLSKLLDAARNNKSVFISLLNDSSNPNFYDFTLKKFKKNYTKQVFDKKPVDDAIDNYLMILKLMKLAIDTESSKKSLKNIIMPENSTQESLSFFIELYDKTLDLFEQKIRINTNLKIEYWFKEKFYNKKSNYGYGFFHREKNNEDGFPVLNIDHIYQKMFSDEKAYNHSSQNPINIFSLSPSYLNLDYRKILFDEQKIVNNKIEYNDLRKNIKKEDFIDYQIQINEVNDINPSKEITVNNLYDKVAVESSQGTKETNINSNTIDKKVDYQNLLLLLSKSSEQAKKEVPIDKKVFQILNIPKDIKYRTDISFDPQFLILYNTICKIEHISTDFAEYVNELKEEYWEPLTTSAPPLRDKDQKTILCRLSIYQDETVSGFSRVELPLYDTYFIVTINQGSDEAYRSLIDRNFNTIFRVRSSNKWNYSVL